MNEYTFDDLKVGQQESFVVTITEAMMNNFYKLTGDCNPLHRDERYASESGYDGCVVYGMLNAGMLSTLAGVYLPGKYCLIQQVEVKFAKPVYVGDTLTVFGEITELHDCVRQAVMKVWITNQMNNKVLRGTVKVGFVQHGE